MGFVAVFVGAASACSTIPQPKLDRYSFPKEAYIQDPKRPYEVLGVVRAKANFNSLTPDYDETVLCKNFYNKAVRDLVKYGKQRGADAVVDVKSVVFLLDGHAELYPQAECADDGEEGQVLVQGIAVKWKKEDPKLSSRARSVATEARPTSKPTSHQVTSEPGSQLRTPSAPRHLRRIPRPQDVVQFSGGGAE